MKLKVRVANGQKLDVQNIREEYIRLDSLLKFAVIAETGGEAKQMILDGEVTVNQVICTQRGKKIRPGDIVRVGGHAITVRQMAEKEYEN